MDNTLFLSYKVEERSYMSIVKREVHKLLTDAGFNSQKVGEANIIVSELTSNLVKHTDHGGEVFFRICQEGDDSFFELFCIDAGPGTNDIHKKIVDGVSSTNTLGQGLGAISRLSDFFQIYSFRGWGTVAFCRKLMSKNISLPVKNNSPLLLRAIQQPIPHERVCGDGYYVIETTDETRIFVGDGLGHGVHAHEAVQKAIEAFKNCDERLPATVLKYIHENVRKTRGLVASIAILDHKQQKWRIGGIGNISTRIFQGIEYKNYTPHNGIIGLNIPNTMNNYEVDAEKYQSIIMCSDGIQSQWSLSKFPSILKYDPAIIAASVFKDFARKRDDMTVVVGKLSY